MQSRTSQSSKQHILALDLGAGRVVEGQPRCVQEGVGSGQVLVALHCPVPGLHHHACLSVRNEAGGSSGRGTGGVQLFVLQGKHSGSGWQSEDQVVEWHSERHH